ncbi:hypothetical protein RRG08_025017 [Elysia crispata]|uniref:Uncharacterized protein n=1 Tax=Elysia crispata TaxID=231223 RepID=A0AAE1E251_9GAST|nr:hypothetical protein RRG08_025017 [Elysia crispata]
MIYCQREDPRFVLTSENATLGMRQLDNQRQERRPPHLPPAGVHVLQYGLAGADALPGFITSVCTHHFWDVLDPPKRNGGSRQSRWQIEAPSVSSKTPRLWTHYISGPREKSIGRPSYCTAQDALQHELACVLR